jgi:predicted nuclease with TOPRIM domain
MGTTTTMIDVEALEAWMNHVDETLKELRDNVKRLSKRLDKLDEALKRVALGSK